MGRSNAVPGLDVVAEMNTFTFFDSMLSDPGAKYENKFKVAQELSKNFEVIVSSPQYPAFLDDAMKNFLKILQDSEPLFIAEYNIQQVRKLILEMFHRLPTNEHLRPYVKQSLILMIRLLERENEDNVLICLQIIIEIHRQYRPKYSVKIQTILQSIKGIYHDDSPNQRNKILKPRSPIEVKDLSKLNFELGVAETFITATFVLTETQTPDGNNISYNLIPKGVSLKVLQELPIIVVLMNQLYKHNVHQDVADFIPLIMTTITLQPSAQHKMNPAFNEIFADFIGAQIIVFLGIHHSHLSRSCCSTSYSNG
jgi:transformation/transcription domain-associated protein